MNKLDNFFKEELDFEEYANTVEEDYSLEFLVEKDHLTFDDDTDTDDENSKIDTYSVADEEDFNDEDTGYKKEQPIDESINLF